MTEQRASAPGREAADGFANREQRITELIRLNLRWDEFYILLFTDGPEGSEWIAIPKADPAGQFSAPTTAQLTGKLVEDHAQRQEARQAASMAAVSSGPDTDGRMSC